MCRKYREGDVIEEAHMVRFTQAIELTSRSIEEVQVRYCDEIKPVVGLFPNDWHAAQRGKVRWYPIKLDGRAMSITRHSGAIELAGDYMCEGGFRWQGFNTKQSGF